MGNASFIFDNISDDIILIRFGIIIPA